MQAQDAAAWKQLERPLNFYLANDLGRNGYYDQKPIAELMGRMAEAIDIEFVVAAGDVHHFEGVRSVDDPLWMTNYELIYSHPDLMLPWYPILGNHEYRGNTQAVIDYSNVSARWQMPARYYTKVMEEDGITVRLVMTDTPPMIDKYRKDTDKYPDAGKQDLNAQLEWVDSVLTVAKEDWVIVVGHHPIYADTDKNDTERTDMQRRLDTILVRHRLCGQFVRLAVTRSQACRWHSVLQRCYGLFADHGGQRRDRPLHDRPRRQGHTHRQEDEMTQHTPRASHRGCPLFLYTPPSAEHHTPAITHPSSGKASLTVFWHTTFAYKT